MAQHMICLGECSIYTWKKKVCSAIIYLFYMCQLDQGDWWCFSDIYLHWFCFFCLILSVSKRGMLKISNHDCGFVSFSNEFCQFCFMYFEVLLLGAYTFIIVMSSWWIVPFVMWDIMLFLVIDFDLKSALSDTSTDTFAFCMHGLPIAITFLST